MQHLFSEFQRSTLADWEKQLIKDLKGEGPETLVWENENGIKIRPFYTREDVNYNYEPAFTHCDWEICVSGVNKNSESINARLLQDLNRGATSISLKTSGIDLEIALKGIQLNFIQSTFYVDAVKALELKHYLEKNYSVENVSMSLFPNQSTNEHDVQEWDKIQILFEKFPNIKTDCIDISNYTNQGALPYYELALAFTQLNELLSSAQKESERSTKRVVIKTAVNTDFFMQIAKLRAYRRLWKLLSKEYHWHSELYIIVETAMNTASLSDRYNNLLRSTMQAMAGVIGGCNELIVLGYDELLHENENLSSRLAINQQLILKHESYLNTMADISCGAYYIETLTDELATKALTAFKEIEQLGGYFKCIDTSVFTNEIEKHALKKEEAINKGGEWVLGVNKFRNEKEKFTLTREKKEELKNKALHNPVLKYELEHFFKA